EGLLLRESAEVSDFARAVARWSEYSDTRVHEIDRRCEQASARFLSIPQAAQTDDGCGPVALLRFVRAARRIRRSEIHPRRGRETRYRSRRASGRRLSGHDKKSVQ